MPAKNTVKLENFARRLADLAEKKKLRQIDIVRALGATTPQVGNWFQGRNGPGKRAGALATLLGTDTGWLLHGVPSENYRPTEYTATGGSPEFAVGDPRRNPAFAEFLALLKGFREEAERLGSGDPDKTRQIFREILKTFERTVPPQITAEDHDNALRDVLDDEDENRKRA